MKKRQVQQDQETRCKFIYAETEKQIEIEKARIELERAHKEEERKRELEHQEMILQQQSLKRLGSHTRRNLTG